MKLADVLAEGSTDRVYILGFAEPWIMGMNVSSSRDIVSMLEDFYFFSSDTKRVAYIRSMVSVGLNDLYDDNPKMKAEIEAMNSHEFVKLVTDEKYSEYFTDNEMDSSWTSEDEIVLTDISVDRFR